MCVYIFLVCLHIYIGKQPQPSILPYNVAIPEYALHHPNMESVMKLEFPLDAVDPVGIIMPCHVFSFCFFLHEAKISGQLTLRYPKVVQKTIGVML